MKKDARRTRQEQKIYDWMREAADAGDCTDSAGVVSPTLMFFDLAAEVVEDYQ